MVSHVCLSCSESEMDWPFFFLAQELRWEKKGEIGFVKFDFLCQG